MVSHFRLGFKNRTASNHIYFFNIGREISEVVSSVAKMTEKKETCFATINKLQKERSNINNRILSLNQQVVRAEQEARDKEQKFNLDKDLSERKVVLGKRIEELTHKEIVLQEQTGPLRQRLM